MTKMLWEVQAPLEIAKIKENIGLNNIWKYLRYYKMFKARFKWKIGEDDYTEIIEKYLFWHGSVILAKDGEFGLVVLQPRDDSLMVNPNGKPVKISGEGENGYKRNDLEIGKDCVIIYADSTRIPPVLYLWAIATEVINVEDIIIQQNNMLRKPIIVYGQGESLDKAMNKASNILSGVEWLNLNPKEKGVKGSNILSQSDTEVLDLQVGNAYKGKELWESRSHYEDLIKDYLGYSSVNNDKKERMVTAEITESKSISETFYNDSLTQRKEGVNQVKNVLGISINLEKNLEQEKEVVENGNQKNEME